MIYLGFIYVVVNFYFQLNFSFPLFCVGLCMAMYTKTKENENLAGKKLTITYIKSKAKFVVNKAKWLDVRQAWHS